MDLLTPLQAAANAARTAEYANTLRAELRGRTTPTDPERVEQIDAMLEQLRLAMIPVRSLIGKQVWEPIPSHEEKALRDASAACQYERRQLKKMLR